MPLWQLTAGEAARRMAAGQLTSEAYTQALLERIAQREPQVQAWAYLDAECALAQARARDREPRRNDQREAGSPALAAFGAKHGAREQRRQTATHPRAPLEDQRCLSPQPNHSRSAIS